MSVSAHTNKLRRQNKKRSFVISLQQSLWWISIIVVLMLGFMVFYLIAFDFNYKYGLQQEFTTEYQSVDFGILKWYQVPEKAAASDTWVLSILSAYYDHRLNKIAILMSSDAADLLSKSSSPFTFMCQSFYDNEPEPIETEAYFFTSYIMYCPLSNSSIIPSKLSIMRNDSEDRFNNWTIPVVNLLERKTTAKPKKLAICVGIMFRYQNWLILLQYIEFHRMQGVEKLIFFYIQLHWSTVKILKWYQIHTNFIEVVKWDPPHYTCTEGRNYWCHYLRVNFCSYNLMYKYRFVGNNDFDELFFPVNGSLLDLLEKYDRPDLGSFVFRAKYHQLLKNDIPEWGTIAYENISSVVQKYIPLYHYINVSTIADPGYSPKTITKPETVLKRWVHYVEIHVEGFETYYFEENQAVLRHFKIREWWGGWADEADTVVKYKFVNPAKEVGEILLRNVTMMVTEMTKRIKSFSNYAQLINNMSIVSLLQKR